MSANSSKMLVDGDVRDKTQLDHKVAMGNGEISQKLEMEPVNETKAPAVNSLEGSAGTLTSDQSDFPTSKIEQNKRDVLSVITESKSEEDVANQTQEEHSRQVTEVESLKDSHSFDKHTHASAGAHLAGKTGDLLIVNGVHKDLFSTEAIQNKNGEARPELVTVKEGYSLAAPKQKVILANEGQNGAELNGISNEKGIGQRENESRGQQRTADVNNGLSPLDLANKERESDKFQPGTGSKQNKNENIVGSFISSTPIKDSHDKLQTSLALSDIPLVFEQLDSTSGKDNRSNSSGVSPEREPTESAGNAADDRERFKENNKVDEIEKGGKPETVNQSHSDEKSRDDADDSLWVLQVPRGGEKGLRKRNEEKRNNENKYKRKRSTENSGEPERVIPRVIVDPSDVFEQNEKDDLEQPREQHTERNDREDEDEEEKPRKRRASEPDVRLEPLSPLMEDRESNNTFLNPSTARSAKVKRNKSLVGRGISKMFGSKRKYKVDKEEKDISPVTGDSDINTTHDEFEFKENRQEKKKKLKKYKGEKKKELQSAEGGDHKSPSRKFGGLFSRGKKKGKNSNQTDMK